MDDEVPDDFDAAPTASAEAAVDEPAPAHLPRPRTPARPTAPPEPAASAAPAPAPDLPPLQTTPLGDQWAAVMRPLATAGGVVAMVRELGWQAELLAVTPAEGGGRRWQLRVERESLRNPSLAAKLAAALGAALGEPAHLDVVAGPAQDCLSRRDNHARDTAQRDAEHVIHNDPIVRELMAQFRTARIVPGSIKPLAADGGEPKANPS
jgi:DNA polymerase-3 subunit gamma/tau